MSNAKEIVNSTRATMEEEGLPVTPYIPPTREQMKAAIKDPSTPAPVRRYLRTQLYGEGGGGHKAVQQEMAQRVKVIPGPVTSKEMKRPAGMSGRQFKKAKRTIREGLKVLRSVKS